VRNHKAPRCAVFTSVLQLPTVANIFLRSLFSEIVFIRYIKTTTKIVIVYFKTSEPNCCSSSRSVVTITSSNQFNKSRFVKGCVSHYGRHLV
jgi:hypothetical protein